MSDDIKALKYTIDQMHREHAAKDAEIKRLKGILHDADATPLAEWATELAARKENADALALVVQEKDAELARLTAANKEAADTIVRLANEADSERQVREQREAEVARLTAERDDYKTAMDNALAEAMDATERMLAAEQRATAAENERDMLKAKAAAMSAGWQESARLAHAAESALSAAREKAAHAAAEWARRTTEWRERTGGRVGMSQLTPTDYAEAARQAVLAALTPATGDGALPPQRRMTDAERETHRQVLAEEMRPLEPAAPASERKEEPGCTHGRDLSKPCPTCPPGARFAEAVSLCGCGNAECRGVTDGERHQCGGPAEACAVPGCGECGTQPTPPPGILVPRRTLEKASSLLMQGDGGRCVDELLHEIHVLLGEEVP